MTKTLIIGLIALTALLASAPAQTGRSQFAGSPASIEQLETTLMHLETRLERLEALASRATPSYFEQDTPATASDPRGQADGRTPHRIMAYVGVETVETNPDAYTELDRLRREEAASLLLFVHFVLLPLFFLLLFLLLLELEIVVSAA